MQSYSPSMLVFGLTIIIQQHELPFVTCEMLSPKIIWHHLNAHITKHATQLESTLAGLVLLNPCVSLGISSRKPTSPVRATQCVGFKDKHEFSSRPIQQSSKNPKQTRTVFYLTTCSEKPLCFSTNTTN